MAKPSRHTILTYDGCDTSWDTSSGTVLATFLHSSQYPVLPPGFGFCVIDNQNGDVLLHSNRQHSLSENLYEETGYNARLLHCAQCKNSDVIDGITLYGNPSMFSVEPIGAQPLSLVTWYDKEVLHENLYRLVHFGAECLLYLYVFIGLCIYFSTYRHNKPPKLRFTIKPTEWIRPSVENSAAYRFTALYFGLLTILVLLGFGMVALFQLDIRLLVYITVLAPFYGIWGFTASRRQERPAFHKQLWQRLARFSLVQLVWMNRVPFLIICVVNWALLALMLHEGFHHGASVVPGFILFQLIVISLLCLFHARCWKIIGRYNIKFSHAFLASLFLSMLLLGVLPITVFITYGFQAEKIQYAKKKQLWLAGNIDQRAGFVNEQLTPYYKPAVQASFLDKGGGAWSYLDSLKYAQGIYLTDRDHVWPGDTNLQRTERLPLTDEPYVTLMDNLFLVTTASYHQYAIGDRSADGSWQFYGSNSPPEKPRLLLRYRNVWPDQQHAGTHVQTFITRPWQSMLVIPPLLLLLLVAGVLGFLAAVALLLRSTMNRLFLLDYFEGKQWLCIDKEWLKKFYASPVDMPACYAHRENVSYPAYIGAEWRVVFGTIEEKEEFILAMTKLYDPVYKAIWAALSPEEQYFLYDFAKDNYTNYKDTETLVSLLSKRVLKYDKNRLRLFCRSFRNYILSKKGSEEIRQLREQFATPGVWETIRIPVLVVITVAALLLVYTQEDFVHQVGALVTSVTTFIPLVSKLAEKMGMVRG